MKNKNTESLNITRVSDPEVVFYQRLAKVRQGWLILYFSRPASPSNINKRQRKSTALHLLSVWGEKQRKTRFLELCYANDLWQSLLVVWSQFSKAQNHTVVSLQHQPWWIMLFSDWVLLFGWTWVRSSDPQTPAGLCSHRLCSQWNTCLLRSTYCIPSNAFKNK